MAHMNIIKQTQFIGSETAEKSKDGKSVVLIRVNQFNEAVGNIKGLMEKLQTYIIKSNNEYERRLKESSSVGRRSSMAGS